MPGFFCDNTTDPCDLVITLVTQAGTNGPTVSASNSAVIPLNFLDQSLRVPVDGSPGDYGGIVLDEPTAHRRDPGHLRHQSRGNRRASSPSTPRTTMSMWPRSFATGDAQVAFIDNPDDVSELATLQGKGYTLIPGGAVGHHGLVPGRGADHVVRSPVDLQPDPQHAGGTDHHQLSDPGGSVTFGSKKSYTFTGTDNLTSALATAGISCAQIVGCPNKKENLQAFNEQALNSFYLFNPQQSGTVQPQSYGIFNSNVSTGSSYEATQWICDAPNTATMATVNEIGQTAPARSVSSTPTAPPPA